MRAPDEDMAGERWTPGRRSWTDWRRSRAAFGAHAPPGETSPDHDGSGTGPDRPDPATATRRDGVPLVAGSANRGATGLAVALDHDTQRRQGLTLQRGRRAGWRLPVEADGAQLGADGGQVPELDAVVRGGRQQAPGGGETEPRDVPWVRGLQRGEFGEGRRVGDGNRDAAR
jgi:hypothetical protein